MTPEQAQPQPNPEDMKFSMAEELTAEPTVAIAADPSLMRNSAADEARVEIQQGFDKAKGKLIEWVDADPKFEVFCAQRGVSARNSGKMNPDFADALMEYGEERRKFFESKGASELHMDTLSIAAATPNAMAQQTILESFKAGTKDFDPRDLSAEERTLYNDARKTLSEYNGRIRDFATANPDVDVNDLSRSAKDMLKSIFFSEQTTLLETKIDAMLRGAQHEMVFGQILNHAGIEYRASTTDEDLQGIDYVLDHTSRNPINIDVKASKHAVADLGFRGPWGRRKNGDIVMYSCVPDATLDGKFFIDEDLAEQVAPVIQGLIDNAKHNIQAP